MSELTLPTPGGDNDTWGTELNGYLNANKPHIVNAKAYGAGWRQLHR